MAVVRYKSETPLSGLPTIVWHEHKRSQQAVGLRNCLTDEGRSLGTGLHEQVPSRNSELAAPFLKSFILRSGLRSGSEASSRRGCRYITTDQVREANEVPMTADHAKPSRITLQQCSTKKARTP